MKEGAQVNPIGMKRNRRSFIGKFAERHRAIVVRDVNHEWRRVTVRFGHSESQDRAAFCYLCHLLARTSRRVGPGKYGIAFAREQ
jgi:hypothetical protein